ncbi:MAG: tetratricopeptide repeat protein [Chthoniobacterales bacterium]
MLRTAEDRGGWRRVVAVVVSAAAVLAGLVALRGPDQLGLDTAAMVGAWKLTGPSWWCPLTLAATGAQVPFWLAGSRGWQNVHVVVAWLTMLCWLVPLPARSWRGLAALVPALIAVLLSHSSSGLAGFGMAVLVLSCASRWPVAADSRRQIVRLAVASWVAVWLSPGALPLVIAVLLVESTRMPGKAWLGTAALCAVACHLTPRGLAIWSEAAVFLGWSPQPLLEPAPLIGLLVSLFVLGIALRATWKTGSVGLALAPAFLLLCATRGQAAYLWPAALWMIPCWDAAKEQLRLSGFNLRWWMQTALLLSMIGLVIWAGSTALPRWYSLAMTEAVVQPTLTREALDIDGPIYLNPGGLALARFAGALPSGVDSGDSARMAREPSLWRARDREVRYRGVWLLGDKADYAPLARHLGESADWRLAAVDATGVFFIREKRSEEFATEPAQQMARGMWGAANRSSFLGGCALSALAANALPEADELAQSAVRNSDRSSPVAATRARVLVSVGDVRAALAASENAIRLDPGLAYAWEVRAEILLHAGSVDEAYAAGRRAADLSPGDAGTLWLAARTANAARAFQSEAEILERLISLTHGRGGDPSFYQLYLGQSYAKQGLTRPALRALAEASAGPGLTAQQRAELQEEMARIESSPNAD